MSPVTTELPLTALLRDDVVMAPITPSRSGPGRPAGADSVDTRRRVLDAACRCFAQCGYGPATNNLIAEMAGVTAGSVYYHFGSKSKLFDAVCEYVYGKIIARSVEALAGPKSVAAPIDARRHAELSEAFAKQATSMITTLADAVAAGQGGGLIPAELDPVGVAGMISAIVGGFAHAAATTDIAAMDQMTELFDRLLLASDSAR